MSDPLPFADEIRAARARSERAHDATMLHRRVQGALHAATILESQVAQGTPYDDEIPGDEELEDAQVWAAVDTSPVEGTILVQLQVRRQRLQHILGALEPLVEDAETAALELHELQHRQHHELEKFEWALVVEELVVIGKRRDTAAQAMAEVQQHLSKVDPLKGVLAGFVPQLALNLAMAGGGEDDDGVAAWRAARLAQQQLVGLANLLNQLEVVISLPFEPAVPDQAHPRHGDRLRDEANAVLNWMHTLTEQVNTRHSLLHEHLAKIKEHHRRAEDELKERMG